MVVHFVLSPEKHSSGSAEDTTGALLEGYEVVGDSRLLTGQEQSDVGQPCNTGFADVSQSLDFSLGMHGNTENFFGDRNDDDLCNAGVYEESVSCEPSLARSSELGDEFHGTFPETFETKPDPAVFDTATAVEVAARSIPAETLEPIWEQGIWGVIFGNKQLIDVYKPFGSSLKRPVDTSIVQGSSGSSEPSSTRAKTGIHSDLSYHDVVQDKLDIPWQEQRDADLQSSVKFWLALVNRWDTACSLVGSMLQLAVTSRVFGMFAHLFAGRSPVTIRKRGYSIMRLCDYLENKGSAFPCSEVEFYDFLCSEQSSKAPQSRLKGYMQSMNFVLHVMSVHEVEPLTRSARCKGACLGEFLKERIQASPLKVCELKRVHELLYTCEDLWVCLFCGALLMAVYCRARWGDLMRAESVITDCDRHGKLQFLEARTGRHKTMKSQMHRHQFLPMVAPCHGVDGRDWGSVWIKVRDTMGLEWPPKGLIMPAPGLQGQATSRPLETQECAAWLRKLVGSPDDPAGRRISSHSLKSTFLSYAAKRGIGISERLQLGYHTSKFEMGMVYSRDGAAASLLVLENLIRDISSGLFDPDDTRSGRIKPLDQPPKHAGDGDVIDIKDESEVVEVSSAESSSDSDSTSSEEERPKCVKHSPVFQPAAAPPGFVMWQHRKLKTLHLMAVENSRVFAYGRNAGALHEKLGKAPEFDTPLCSLCFNRSRD